MKQFILSILFLSFVTSYSQENCKYPDKYTPKTIKDALLYLNCIWSETDKENFQKQNEKEAVAELHFGTGMGIRNDWGFWNKRKCSLVKELQFYGFSHPDDMSWIILTLFHKQLNNSNINIETELLQYKKINQDAQTKDKSLEKEIKQKYEDLSAGDTIKVPLPVFKNGKTISFGLYSNRMVYDDFDCIITGIIKKKNKKGYSLTIEIIEISFKDEDYYKMNSKKKKGNVFLHEMKYFTIIM